MSDIGHKKRVTTFLTHLLFICILFILPEVLSTLASPWRGMSLWMYVKGLMFIAVFYINYYFIIERSLTSRRSVWKFVIYNLILTAVVLTVTYIGWRMFSHGFYHRHRKVPEPTELQMLAKAVSLLLRDFVMLTLTIGLSVALRMGDRWLNLERRSRELVVSRREEELKNLKSQLNPHFLFNTLNSIYALIAISPVKAQNAVHELSRLLRYVLYESPGAVTVKQELEFVDNYVKLMRLRLNPGLKMNVTLDAGPCADSMIAPLLFITVIENVFKHGNTGNPADTIDISITASAGRITCVTSNAVAPDTPSRSGKQGIGEQNLRRRLALLYGSDASFAANRDGNRYNTELTINLNHILPA